MVRFVQIASLAVGFFVLGIWWQSTGPAALADPTTATKEPQVFPMEARLGSNIWLQTSAEYRACCTQIYKLAGQRLNVILKSAGEKYPRPAIVMDLDETVFDNSAFQTFLYANKFEYTQKLWDEYEDKYWKDTTLIPGAKEFIDYAEAQGVAVVYISNRTVPYQASAIKAIASNGLSTAGIEQRLLLRAAEGSSDKAARRDLIEAKYNVLMYFGDNLRDFSEAFAASKLAKDATPADYRKAIEERKKAADEAACHWGIDWFVIPNPVYGEWEKLIGPKPVEIMHPTTMPIRK